MKQKYLFVKKEKSVYKLKKKINILCDLPSLGTLVNTLLLIFNFPINITRVAKPCHGLRLNKKIKNNKNFGLGLKKNKIEEKKNTNTKYQKKIIKYLT